MFAKHVVDRQAGEEITTGRIDVDGDFTGTNPIEEAANKPCRHAAAIATIADVVSDRQRAAVIGFRLDWRPPIFGRGRHFPINIVRERESIDQRDIVTERHCLFPLIQPGPFVTVRTFARPSRQATAASDRSGRALHPSSRDCH